jgi:transcriptional regulator with XRE-family HTH domain
MEKRRDVLDLVMRETGTTQSELSRISGVHQSSLSQFLSGTVDLSDRQLDRLLSCMGRRLVVERRPVVPHLTRSERRSWMLHRRLSRLVTTELLRSEKSRLQRNLERERGSVRGEVHRRNVDRWQTLLEQEDLRELRRVLTGLDRDAIEMREVSPLGGLLPEGDRLEVLEELRRSA